MPARALALADVDAADVDLVILATMTADQVCPATAASVQAALGTRGAAFDLNAACAGFVHALHEGAATLGTPGIDRVLVIGSERVSSIVDPDDRGTAILFGDGAGAVLAVIAPDASDEVKREIAKAVEAIAPGAIETPFNSALLNNPKKLNSLLHRIPLGYIAKP